MLFEDVFIPAQFFVGKSYGIFKAFPLPVTNIYVSSLTDPCVDESFPWDFMDGTSQGRPKTSGAGGILW